MEKDEKLTTEEVIEEVIIGMDLMKCLRYIKYKCQRYM